MGLGTRRGTAMANPSAFNLVSFHCPLAQSLDGRKVLSRRAECREDSARQMGQPFEDALYIASSMIWTLCVARPAGSRVGTTVSRDPIRAEIRSEDRRQWSNLSVQNS